VARLPLQQHLLEVEAEATLQLTNEAFKAEVGSWKLEVSAGKYFDLYKKRL
jgi:hypothetical protein